MDYQPVMDLDTASRSAWRRSSAGSTRPGLIPPSDFIAAAEEAGVIIAIGALVLQPAARQVPLAVTLRNAGLWLRSTSPSANLTGRGSPRWSGGSLQQARFDPRRLVLEVTETV